MARSKQMSLQFLLRGYLLVKAAEGCSQMLLVTPLYEGIYNSQLDLQYRIEAEGLQPLFVVQRDNWRDSSVMHALGTIANEEGIIEISANSRKVRFKIESEQEALEMLSRKSMWNLQLHLDLAFLIDITIALLPQSSSTPTPTFIPAEQIKRIA